MPIEYGTVITTFDGPSTRKFAFVINDKNSPVRRGQYVAVAVPDGMLIARVADVLKTNRYFSRPESVSEFEKTGRMETIFPVGEWECLIAEAEALGVFADSGFRDCTFPPSPGSRVLEPEPSSLQQFFGLDPAGVHLGSLSQHRLDVRLGLDRLLKKHVAVLAMSGAGKCLDSAEKIFVEGSAQMKIGELVDSVLKQNRHVEDGVEFWEADCGTRVYALRNGKVAPANVRGYYRRKAPEGLVRITTRTGRSIRVTPEHLVPVFTGRLEWKEARSVSEADYVFLPRIAWEGKDAIFDFTSIAGRMRDIAISEGRAVPIRKSWMISIPLVHQADPGFARLLAYLLAEGHNTLGTQMNFANMNLAIQEDFAGLFRKAFGIVPRSAKDGTALVFNSVVLAKCLESIGFTNSSWTKFVPPELLQSKRDVLENFLSAFIDCDGYVNPKKAEVNITVASPRLADGIDEMLTKLGVIPLRRKKKVDGKEYQMVIVSGAAEISKLRSLRLLVDYKMAALEKWCSAKGNTNIDVIPNMHSHLREALRFLRMPQPQAESTGINNYLYRRDDPSRESLAVLVELFAKRAEEVEVAITQMRELQARMPVVDEAGALEVVKEAYKNGATFKDIASGTGVSGTTARRVVRGITAPKRTVFLLAQNALLLQRLGSEELDAASDLDGNEILVEAKALCEALNYSTEELCAKVGCYKQFLYSHAGGRGSPDLSTVISFVRELGHMAEESKNCLVQARAIIAALRQLLELNAFFDRVQNVEAVPPTSPYVYDLSVEDSNFTAGNILVHNSYLTSVVIEELLKRANGKLAIVVLDVHGEYSGLSEDATYGGQVRVFPAHELRIGVSELSPWRIADYAGLSGVQTRELARAMDRLAAGFDLNDLVRAVEGNKELGTNTRDAMASALEDLKRVGVFGAVDKPGLDALAVPGQLTVLDFSQMIRMRAKQFLVAHIADQLFAARRHGVVPPFVLVVEEAHQFIPEKAEKKLTPARGILQTIAREGRKFHASLCLISQRPVQLSTTVLSQCVTPDTLVTRFDGYSTPIGEMARSWAQSEVMSYDLERRARIERVPSAYLSKNPEWDASPVFELSTNRRKIKATADHPFWVEGRGWMPAWEVEPGQRVAVRPLQEFDLERDAEERRLLAEADIQPPHPVRRNELIGKLRAMGLLPLTTANPKLSIVARLLGHIYGDGTLHSPYRASNGQWNHRITFTGKEEELIEVKKDLARLGFAQDWKIQRQFRESTSRFLAFGNRPIKGVSTCFKVGLRPLWFLLEGLGAPVGDKSGQAAPVPSWIMKAPRHIKREFLAAYIGSEGSSIRFKKRWAEEASIPFCKSQSLGRQGIRFARQIQLLLSEFEVETSCFSRPYCHRKDGSSSTQFTIRIKAERSNIIRFCRRIGYRYSPSKEAHSLRALAFLEHIEALTAQKQGILAAVHAHSGPITISHANQWGVQVATARSWRSRTIAKVRLCPTDHLPNFDEWVAQNCEGLGDSLFWDTIISKEQATADDVRDLTIPDTHCFFANGFLTHNCNTNIILRITNPYDLKHISESSEGITRDVQDQIATLPVGTALVLGEATNYPLFIKVRRRESHLVHKDIGLEQASEQWQEKVLKKRKDAKAFL